MHDDLLSSTFQRFDVDNSGYITASNLQEVLGDSFSGAGMEELIKEADFEKDGRISYDEFIRYLQGSNVLSQKLGGTLAKHIDREVRDRKSEMLRMGTTMS